MCRVFPARRLVHWLIFLLCSGVGLTTTRRIGQAPRLNEATVMTADDLKLYTARASGQRPLQKRRSMAAFGGTADRAAASPRPPNKIRQFLQSIFPASRPGKIMGRPVRG